MIDQLLSNSIGISGAHTQRRSKLIVFVLLVATHLFGLQAKAVTPAASHSFVNPPPWKTERTLLLRSTQTSLRDYELELQTGPAFISVGEWFAELKEAQRVQDRRDLLRLRQLELAGELIALQNFCTDFESKLGERPLTTESRLTWQGCLGVLKNTASSPENRAQRADQLHSLKGLPPKQASRWLGPQHLGPEVEAVIVQGEWIEDLQNFSLPLGPAPIHLVLLSSSHQPEILWINSETTRLELKHPWLQGSCESPEAVRSSWTLPPTSALYREDCLIHNSQIQLLSEAEKRLKSQMIQHHKGPTRPNPSRWQWWASGLLAITAAIYLTDHELVIELPAR